MKVEIMPCGTKAKTLNRYGEELPTLSDFLHGSHSKHEWRQAESERKVYEIDCWVETNGGQTMDYIPRWEPGSIHEATEINTKQIRIL